MLSVKVELAKNIPILIVKELWPDVVEFKQWTYRHDEVDKNSSYFKLIELSKWFVQKKKLLYNDIDFLCMAIDAGNIDVIQYYSTANTKYSYDIIRFATTFASPAIVKYLLQQGYPNPELQPPLLDSCDYTFKPPKSPIKLKLLDHLNNIKIEEFHSLTSADQKELDYALKHISTVGYLHLPLFKLLHQKNLLNNENVQTILNIATSIQYTTLVNWIVENFTVATAESIILSTKHGLTYSLQTQLQYINDELIAKVQEIFTNTKLSTINVSCLLLLIKNIPLNEKQLQNALYQAPPNAYQLFN